MTSVPSDQDVQISIALPQWIAIQDLVAGIIEPRVAYNRDQLFMAKEAIQVCQDRAEEILRFMPLEAINQYRIATATGGTGKTPTASSTP